MTSQSPSVADHSFHVDCQRPAVPGCGDVLTNDLPTTSKYCFICDVSLANTWLSPSLTAREPYLHQEPDGCVSNTALCAQFCEAGQSKMDSLVSLLNDRHGVTYLRQFLSTKQACQVLEFWLACVGYRKVEAARCSSFALVIYKTFIAAASSHVRLAVTTRRAIKERLKSGNVDHTVFDDAMAEVATLLLRDYYPLFLESDDYVEYIRTRSSSESLSSEGSSGHSSNCGQLQAADQRSSKDQLCKVSLPACKRLDNVNTCSQMYRSIQCASESLAHSGCVVTCFSLFSSLADDDEIAYFSVC